jgi:hypothetical protein
MILPVLLFAFEWLLVFWLVLHNTLLAGKAGGGICCEEEEGEKGFILTHGEGDEEQILVFSKNH